MTRDEILLHITNHTTYHRATSRRCSTKFPRGRRPPTCRFSSGTCPSRLDDRALGLVRRWRRSSRAAQYWMWLAAAGGIPGCSSRSVWKSPPSIANPVHSGSTFHPSRPGRRSPWPLPGERFEGIVVTNYLHRPLFPTLAASLAPGGVLIYETFMLGNERFGKPSNPAFLLRPGELRETFKDLTLKGFEEGEVREPKSAMIQRLCAIRAA